MCNANSRFRPTFHSMTFSSELMITGVYVLLSLDVDLVLCVLL